MRTQVVIVGGGIAGLTLALTLVAQNIEVIIIEKALTSAKYKGELIHPKSLYVLEKRGVLQEVLQNGNPIQVFFMIMAYYSRQLNMRL